MHLIDMPPQVEAELVHAVQNLWGLQNREALSSGQDGQVVTTELKMSGNPWMPVAFLFGAGEEGVQLRRLLMEMIRVMRRC